MSSFSASDVGLAGFRYARENPKVLGVWAVFFAAGSFLFSWLTVVLAGPAMAQLQAMQGQTNPDPQATLATLAPLGTLTAVVGPLALIYYAIIYAAVNRLILRPNDGGLAFMKFGADEFRQIGVLLLMALAIFGVYVIGVIAVAVLAGVLSVVSPILGGFAVFVGIVAVVAAIVFLAVRISLASASTFKTGRIGLRESWTLTKGRFWPITGAYLLSLVMVIIISCLGFVIFAAVAMLIGGGIEGVGKVMSPDMATVESYFTPVRILYLLFGAVLTAMTTLVSMAPAALIYSHLTDDVADAF